MLPLRFRMPDLMNSRLGPNSETYPTQWTVSPMSIVPTQDLRIHTAFGPVTDWDCNTLTRWRQLYFRNRGRHLMTNARRQFAISQFKQGWCWSCMPTSAFRV